MQDPDLEFRLRATEPQMTALSGHFQQSVQSGQTHALPNELFKLSAVSGKEMAWVYRKRMAQEGAPGRYVYDELMLQTTLCPYCGQTKATTLDHYLPKALFPAVAIDPMNLVPACKDCNTGKGVQVSGVPEEEPLHPYFDYIDGERWLHAEVLHVEDPAAVFFVAPPAGWPAQLASRVKASFKRFDLAVTYASQASGEVRGLCKYLAGHYARDPDSARTHLIEMADSRAAARLNSWQSALYAALSTDEWFYTGGFLPAAEQRSA